MRFQPYYSIFLLLVLAVSAGASPALCPTSGTYADLLATNLAGGCVISDLTFSEFTYQPTAGGGAIPVAAENFSYIVRADAPVAVGFQFGFTLVAQSGQSNDILISWLVTGPDISSNHLLMAGTAFGDSVASIAETYCVGGPIAGCPEFSVGTLLTYSFGNGSEQPANNAYFGPVGQLGVLKDINVTVLGTGYATISGVSQTVDQTPEPATMFVGGASLLLMSLARRFRRQH